MAHNKEKKINQAHTHQTHQATPTLTTTKPTRATTTNTSIYPQTHPQPSHPPMNLATHRRSSTHKTTAPDADLPTQPQLPMPIYYIPH